MARKKKQAGVENTEGWLTSYADLISLLLCFFVLMYTSSTPDEAKLQWILRQMQPTTGTVVNVVVDDPISGSTDGDENFEGIDPEVLTVEGGDQPGIAGTMPMTFDELFNWVSDAISSNDLSSSMSVSSSEGRLHIRFDSDVMFAGNSSVLQQSGRRALDVISPGISAINDYIATVAIEGHTAPQAGVLIGGMDDWELSSARAVSVLHYLSYNKRMVDSNKFSATGLGQHHPHYPTDNLEDNAKNRRVEIVITRNHFNEADTPVILDILNYDYGLGPIPGSDGDTRAHQPGQHDREAEIRKELYDKYGVIEVPAGRLSEGGKIDVGVGPVIPVLPSRPSGASDDESENTGNSDAD